MPNLAESFFESAVLRATQNIELGSYELNPLPGVDVVAPALVPPTATEPALQGCTTECSAVCGCG
jgi:hypothetical protein